MSSRKRTDEAAPASKKVRQTVQPITADFVNSASSVSDRLKLLKLAESNASGFIKSSGLTAIADWLEQAVQSQEIGLVHACLGCLEKLPMTLDLLQSSKIGRRVNESLKSCSNQVAIERARKLINGWKLIASNTSTSPATTTMVAPPPSSRRSSESISSPPVELVEPVREQSAATDGGEDTAADALASLLESLPELEGLATDIPAARRGIIWKPDSQLVQMVEFGILETCEDLRRRIDETHGGLNALHIHGEESAEELRRFQESRKRERAMGGNRLRMHFQIDEDDIEDIEAMQPAWYWPPKVKVLSLDAIHDPRKMRSYERQDLADMHGSRPERVYASTADIPDSPAEPSSTSFKLQQNTTIDILLGGTDQEPIDLEEPVAAEETTPAEPAVREPPASTSQYTTFDDEFVKLDSNVQTCILASEDLLSLFTREPGLLKGITSDKLDLILNEFKKPPVAHTVPLDDRKTWGASTIRSAVRNEVMGSFVPPPPGPMMPFPPAAPYPPPRFSPNAPDTYMHDGSPSMVGAFPPSQFQSNAHMDFRGPPPVHDHRGPPPQYRGPPPPGPPLHAFPVEYGRHPPPLPHPGYHGRHDHRGPPPHAYAGHEDHRGLPPHDFAGNMDHRGPVGPPPEGFRANPDHRGPPPHGFQGHPDHRAHGGPPPHGFHGGHPRGPPPGSHHRPQYPRR